jgi:hypothetical protein
MAFFSGKMTGFLGVPVDFQEFLNRPIWKPIIAAAAK